MIDTKALIKYIWQRFEDDLLHELFLGSGRAGESFEMTQGPQDMLRPDYLPHSPVREPVCAELANPEGKRESLQSLNLAV